MNSLRIRHACGGEQLCLDLQRGRRRELRARAAAGRLASRRPGCTSMQPLPEALARGLAVIRYRTENLRIVPVFGPGALDVSPRVGHLHVSVDGSPWHWADASGVPLIIQGLPVGPHKVLVELADPTHTVHREQDRRILHSGAERDAPLRRYQRCKVTVR